MSKRLPRLLAFAVITYAAAAWGLNQPDGTVIPQGNSLQDLFTSRGEAIDAKADAATVPETYIPSCALTFEVLQRDAGYSNSFGWYNVTGAKPDVSELHEFLTCNDAVGTVKMLDIKNDPAYAGGEIGFYEATGPCATLADHLNIFFSQKEYNPDGDAANPYVHMLTYNSTVTPKAFYFGWEDLLSGPGNPGDNDFNDLTTFVTGITCSGGGGACQTGQPGICADGTLQCQMGVLTCVQSSQPTREKCDGLDNDCNGLVDDGDLCAQNEVCDKGTCVPKCGGGEFECPPTKECNASGYCVDPACIGVTCPEGTKCVAGDCVAPCDGVVCPYGQVCLVGACLDPCGSITCDADQVCVLGACVEHCSCAGCDTGLTCQMDGTCSFDACVGKTCDAGFHCDASGNCVDDCRGAVCPSGRVCEAGECVEGAGTGGGGSGGAGGSPFNFGGEASGGSGGAATAGTGNAPSAGPPQVVEAEGCGCRVAGAPERAPLPTSFLMALSAAVVGMRRRRSSSYRGTRSSSLLRWAVAAAFAVGALPSREARAQLYVNGTLSTGPTANDGTTAPAGSNWSELQNDSGNNSEANGSNGFPGNAQTARLADDFTVPEGQVWTIQSVAFFAYKFNAPVNPTPFVSMTLQVWGGVPDQANSAIIAGDDATDVLSSSTFADIYRIANTTVPPPGTSTSQSRRVWRNEATFMPPLVLTAGTYWLDWASTDSTGGTHSYPSATVVGSRTQQGWNARQKSVGNGTWSFAVDTGAPNSAPDVFQDFPFEILGTAEGDCGDGIPFDEPCDDGNDVEGDGCDSNCTVSACGNGIISDPEECDDGNTDAGDGCDARCFDEVATGTGGTGGVGPGGAGGASTTTAGSGGSSATGGAAPSGSGGANAASGGGSDAPTGVFNEDTGCSCALVGDQGQHRARAFALWALALAGLARRRRARRP